MRSQVITLGRHVLPYEDLIKAFKNGDVIYGLRDPLLDAASRVDQPREMRKRSFPLLGKKVAKATGLIQADITNAVWDANKPTRYSSDKEIERALVEKELGVGFREHLREHRKYNVAAQYADGLLDAKDEKVDLRTAWGRTSKGGLEYHLNRGASVHFVITGVGLDDVASKNGTGGPGFITAKELRWLHRNQHDDAVKKRVKFYTEDAQLDAETYLSRPEWDRYIRRDKPQPTSSDDVKVASGSSSDPQYFKALVSGSNQQPRSNRNSTSTVSTMKFRQP